MLIRLGRHIPISSITKCSEYVRLKVLADQEDGAQNQTYNFTSSGITWSANGRNYVAAPNVASYSDVLPPPNWALRFPNGYTNATPWPNLQEDEHFQVWMRIAALPTFRKIWARNDNEVMASGRYSVTAYMSKITSHSRAKNCRLSGQAIFGHEIDCDLNGFVDRGKAAFLGMGLCGSSHCVCRLSSCRNGEAFGKTQKTGRHEL